MDKIKEAFSQIIRDLAPITNPEIRNILSKLLLTELDAAASDEQGLRDYIHKLVAMEMPLDKLGLVDGTVWDTWIRRIIDTCQMFFDEWGSPREELPPNAPIAGELIKQGMMCYLKGGSNRTEERYYAAIEAKKEELRSKYGSVQACQNTLAYLFRDQDRKCDPQNWELLYTKKEHAITVRAFKCDDLVYTCVYDENETDEDKLQLLSYDLFPEVKEGLILSLTEVAGKIKHCGDYGLLYYSPSQNNAYWCAGDGDGEDPTTDLDDIESILKVDGVASVTVEAEHSPSLGEGYLYLGQFGEVVEFNDDE